MEVLVVNAGSSSVKFSLYADGAAGLSLVTRGQAEGLFTSPRFVAKGSDGERRCAGVELGEFEQRLGEPAHLLRGVEASFDGFAILLGAAFARQRGLGL